MVKSKYFVDEKGESCGKKFQVNECESNPCVGEGSKCIDLDDGFECICQDQIRTGTFCEEKLDFCDSKQFCFKKPN